MLKVSHGNPRTHDKEVEEVPQSDFADEQMMGLRSWLPHELAGHFSAWRFTPGNTWPPHTEVERKEFWQHATRLGVDTSKYLSRKKNIVAPGNKDTTFIPTLSHLMNVDEVLLQAVCKIESGGRGMGPNDMPSVPLPA